MTLLGRLSIVLLLTWAGMAADAFIVRRQQCAPTTSTATTARRRTKNKCCLWAVTGDPLRAATGIRPSLHPLTINAISTVLQKRMSQDSKLRVDQDGVQGVEVALAASQIAADALQKRQERSKEDDMQLTPEEGQTVAGRVVGVTMRLPQLEQSLNEKCHAVSWIAKYHEWSSFGVLPDESSADAVDVQIKMDPLFSMNRAECLLALFLATVEKPELEAKGASVPDGSRIDFLDADRQQVLIGE